VLPKALGIQRQAVSGTEWTTAGRPRNNYRMPLDLSDLELETAACAWGHLVERGVSLSYIAHANIPCNFLT
jgi:hypothetical protein